jgi:predicted ArsR family transcriptional regulator
VALSRWKRVLMASTKGQVVDLLRRGPRTVEELAQALRLTDNAIRGHLTALERDGLARRSGTRRTGARRPSHTYRLTPEGELLFSQAYVPFLDELLHVLAGIMPVDELQDVARAVGRRLVALPGSAAASTEARVRAAANLLDDLGGVTEIQKAGNGNGSFTIHGLSCPFGSLVRAHGEVCMAVESLVGEVTKEPTRERCERKAESPQCWIDVTPREPEPTRRPRLRAS